MHTEHNAMLAAIVSATDDAIIGTTLEGIITTWNAGATLLLGYTEDEATGENISMIIPRKRLSEESEILKKIGEGESFYDFETTRIARDGTEKFVSVTISPIRNTRGKVIGASRIARDISQKKMAEEKQSILAAIVDSSDDAIVSKTLDGIITSWNKAAQRLFGFSETEVIGKHISIIIPPERMDEEAMIISNIRSGKSVDHFETVRLAKDGTERYISLTVSPVKDRRGNVIGASKIARDISLRIQAEQERERYIRQLHELNEYKDEFMVMASHELKTPLTVILANLQILEHLMQDDPYLPQLKKTISKSQKMAELIGDLLDVTKIQSGKMVLNISPFDVNELIAEVISNLKITAASHTFIFENDGVLMINADQYRIEQVLTNIIGNAIKYAPDGGNIMITTRAHAGTAQIEVRDEGIGIPGDDLENVFERFYRSRGMARSFSGSGVGLYISHEIIKKHHGTIRVQSEEGKGSSFVIAVPLSA